MSVPSDPMAQRLDRLIELMKPISHRYNIVLGRREWTDLVVDDPPGFFLPLDNHARYKDIVVKHLTVLKNGIWVELH